MRMENETSQGNITGAFISSLECGLWRWMSMVIVHLKVDVTISGFLWLRGFI